MGDGSLGTLQVGKLADLILVDGDPLADPRVLVGPDNILLVMKDGQVQKNTLPAAPAITPARQAVPA
jgi:imidazolonepropionase-like amidohydrolase